MYLTETAAWYGSNLSDRRTPIAMAVTVYNPKPYPYAVTEVGFEIRMNRIHVGDGASLRSAAIPGGSGRTIRATTDLRNERLDDWWVSHLERDQVTNPTVDTYVVVDPDASGVIGETVPAVRIDSDELDDEAVVETDIVGTTDSDGLESDSGTGDRTPTPRRDHHADPRRDRHANADGHSDADANAFSDADTHANPDTD